MTLTGALGGKPHSQYSSFASACAASVVAAHTPVRHEYIGTPRTFPRSLVNTRKNVMRLLVA